MLAGTDSAVKHKEDISYQFSLLEEFSAVSVRRRGPVVELGMKCMLWADIYKKLSLQEGLRVGA
jgi:hypothetical protein